MNLSEQLNNIHCVFQELENVGVELPMGDYQQIYLVLEEARDIHEDPCIFLMGNLSEGFMACGPYAGMGQAFDIHDGDEGWGMSLNASDLSEDNN